MKTDNHTGPPNGSRIIHLSPHDRLPPAVSYMVFPTTQPTPHVVGPLSAVPSLVSLDRIRRPCNLATSAQAALPPRTPLSLLFLTAPVPPSALSMSITPPPRPHVTNQRPSRRGTHRFIGEADVVASGSPRLWTAEGYHPTPPPMSALAPAKRRREGAVRSTRTARTERHGGGAATCVDAPKLNAKSST